MAPKVAAEREVNAMSIRLWRRFKVAPGIRLNLSKSGLSTSFGTHGMWYTIGPRGQRVTAGLPGSGLFVTEKISPGPAAQKLPPAAEPARSSHMVFPWALFTFVVLSVLTCGRYSIGWAASPLTPLPIPPFWPPRAIGAAFCRFWALHRREGDEDREWR